MAFFKILVKNGFEVKNKILLSMEERMRQRGEMLNDYRNAYVDFSRDWEYIYDEKGKTSLIS